MMRVSVHGKGLKLQKGKESVEALKSQEEEKCTFTDGKNTRERTKKETLPMALKKNKTKFAVNFDRCPTLKFS